MLAAASAVVLALAPGVYAYLSSRKLLAHVDDPLLPDLLLSRAHRLTTAFGLSVGAGIVLVRPYVLELAMGALAGSVLGSFPARKRIFDETWSVFGYLSHTLRFWLAMLLSLFLIMGIPVAMERVGEPWAVAVAGALGGLALAYVALASALFPKILRARPLARPELEAPFEAVVAKARCGRPSLYEARARGGSWVNAFALSSIGRPAVLFTAGLLDSLDARETTAIFAHEIAHLEHHSRKRQALGLTQTALLAGVPIYLWTGPLAGTVTGYAWAWPLVIAFALAARARSHRGHETASDLRGAELCGDPEALVSGLTKLHTLMRVPRRWSEQHESRSSHPSLARRIQAIRRAHADSPEREPLETAVFFAADGSRRAVVLDAERLHLLTGVDESDTEREPLIAASERRSIPYAQLRELRLEGANRRLLFVESSGRKTKISIDGQDVTRLSALLDRVDLRLDYRVAPPAGRIASLAVALLALSPMLSWILAVVGMLAAALPSKATLAAAGMGGLVAAVATGLRGDGGFLWRAAALGAASLFCLGVALAHHRKRAVDSRVARWVAIVAPSSLALVGAVPVLGGLLSPLPFMAFHLWAREAIGVTVGWVAAAAALTTVPDRKLKLLSLVPATLALAVLVSGTLVMGQRFGGDLFSEMPRLMEETRASYQPLRFVSLGEAVDDLVLSPGGKHFYASVNEGEAYLVETPRGLERLTVLALAFIDDERLATVVVDGQGSSLTLDGRRLALPPLSSMRLAVDSRVGAWQVRGYDRDDYESVLLTGRLDSSEFETVRFSWDEEDPAIVDAVSAEGWALLFDYPYPFPDASVLGSLGLYPSPAAEFIATELAMRRPDRPPRELGRTLLMPTCYQASLLDALFVCAARYGGRTSLFSIEPVTRRLVPIGSVSGEYYFGEPAGGGELTLGHWHEAPLLVDLEAATVTHVPRGDVRWELVAWRGDVLANATTDESGTASTVTLFRLDAPER